MMFIQFIIAGFLSFSSFAQVCPEITPINWLLKEVEDTHPQLLFKRLQLDQLQAKEYEAKKFINPELEHFSVWGREFEPKPVYMNESRLWFTLQLANKRKDRTNAWEKALRAEKFDEKLLKQALLKDLWLNFFRLHQIYDEMRIKNKIISKLEFILGQYQKRKYLSPDQTLEERIIKMVLDNFQLSKNYLQREKLSIFEFLKEVTGYQCQISKVSELEDNIRWPKPRDLEGEEKVELVLSKMASLQFDLNSANAILADKKAIPDLRIAPVFQNYQSGTKDVYTAGLSFVFPLPVFDRNQSERFATTYQKEWAHRQIELSQKKEQNRLNFHKEKYKSGLFLVKELEVIEESLSKFDNVETKFKEGKLSINNVVEFCRQLDDIMKNYHIGETSLMNDLLQIYELKGLINSEHLIKLID